MENKLFKKEDLAEMLAKKTGFYKCNMIEVATALEDVIIECLKSATLEQDSEIKLIPGISIYGHRVPTQEAKDPRTGEMILSPEKVIPRAVFKQSIRQKLYKKSKYYKKKKTKKV